MNIGPHELRAHQQGSHSRFKPPAVSFEFFPPGTAELEKTLWRSVEKLERLQPNFVSVTYGADGSTRERTHNAIAAIQERGNTPTMPHLTCVGASREEINDIAEGYWDIGVRRIMALRGDPPGGAGQAYTPLEGGYAYAEQLVEGLKTLHDFDVYVAAYPETHPDAPSPHFDLQNLKRKFDAGATAAVTQYFFDTSSYLRFRDAALREGIDKPIIPGILPVTNFATLQRFSKACGTNLPKWLCESFEGLDEDPEIRQLIAANIAIEQVMALQAEGVDTFHFYTLNRAELCFAVCHALGLRAPNASAENSADKKAQGGEA